MKKLLGGEGGAVLLALLVGNVASVSCAAMPGFESVAERFRRSVEAARLALYPASGGRNLQNIRWDWAFAEEKLAHDWVIKRLLEEDTMMGGLRSLEEILASPTEREKYFTVAESNYLKHMLADKKPARAEEIRRRRMRRSTAAFPTAASSRVRRNRRRPDYRDLFDELRLSLLRKLRNGDTSLLPDFASILYLEWQVIDGTNEKSDNDATAASKEKRFLEKFEETEDLIDEAFLKSNTDKIDKRLEDVRERLKAIYTAPPMTTMHAYLFSHLHFWPAALQAHNAIVHELAPRDSDSPEEEDEDEEKKTQTQKKKKKTRTEEEILLDSAWHKRVFEDCQRATTKAMDESQDRPYKHEGGSKKREPNEVPTLQRLSSYAVKKQPKRDSRALPKHFHNRRDVLMDFTSRILHPPTDDV